MVILVKIDFEFERPKVSQTTIMHVVPFDATRNQSTGAFFRHSSLISPLRSGYRSHNNSALLRGRQATVASCTLIGKLSAEIRTYFTVATVPAVLRTKI